MRSAHLTSLLLPALLLAVWGCEAPPAPAERPLPTEPALSRNDPQSLTRVAGAIPEFYVEAVIGPEGGDLGVPGFTLRVPRGAVSAPARFTFESVHEGYVEVKLTATAVGSSTPNDVGAAGFRVPLLLGLSVDPAGGMREWSRLVVVRVLPDGALQPLPSTYNPVLRMLVGSVDHFSTFAMGGG
jgi:hypothetical protein